MTGGIEPDSLHAGYFEKPPGTAGGAIAIIALLTTFIAGIAVRTVALAAAGIRPEWSGDRS